MLRKVRDLFVAYNKRAGGRTLTQAMLLGFAPHLCLRDGDPPKHLKHRLGSSDLNVTHNLFRSLQFI